MIESIYEVNPAWPIKSLVKLARHEKVEPGLKFEIADGLHWFLSDNHGGQFSEFYEALCELEYGPSPLASGPDSTESWWLYEQLEAVHLKENDRLIKED